MKRVLAIVIVIIMLANLTACGAKPSDAEPTTGMPNPWRECTAEEAAESCQKLFLPPAGAENIRWSMMDAGQEADAGRLVQLDFDLDGMAYTARAQQGVSENTDVSGIYETWDMSDALTLGDWGSGMIFRVRHEADMTDLCTWYDSAAKTAYALSVTAADLDGFDLTAIAVAMYPVSQPQTGSVPTSAKLADGFFRVIDSFHPGTAGSSLGAAQAACQALGFAAEHSLRDADDAALRDAVLTAWESLTEEERSWFRENFSSVDSLIANSAADWEGNRGLFEDAGVGDAMKKLLADPLAMEAWEKLRDQTASLRGFDGE